MSFNTIFDKIKLYLFLCLFIMFFFACSAGEYKRELSDNRIDGFISEFIEFDTDHVVVSNIDRSVIVLDVTIKRIKSLEKSVDTNILVDSITLFPILNKGEKLSGGFHVHPDDINDFIAFFTDRDRVNNTINVRFFSNDHKMGELKKMISLIIDLSPGSDVSTYLKESNIQEINRKHKFNVAITEFEIDSDVSGKLKTEARDRILAGLKNNHSAVEINFTDTVNDNTDCVINGIILSQNVVNMNKNLVVTSYDVTVSSIEAVSGNIIDSWTENSSKSFENAAIAMKLLSPGVYLQRADRYIKQHYYDLALIDYNTILQIEPELKSQALIGRGKVHLAQENFDLALLDFNEAIGSDPEYADSFVGLGDMYTGEKAYDSAINMYSEALRLDPNLISALSGRGFALVKNGMYEDGLKDCNEVLRIKPTDIDALKIRGEAFLGLKDYDKSIADFSHVLNATSDNAEVFFDRSLAYYLLENFTNALDDINNAIALDGDSAIYYSLRASTYIKLDNYDKALLNINMAMSISPDSEQFFARGTIYKNTNKYDLAIVDYTNAIKMAPKESSYFNGRAEAYTAQEHYELAIEDYSKAIGIAPSVACYYRNRANVKSIMADYNSAIQDYWSALNLDPDDILSFIGRANAFLSAEKYDSAIRDYTIIIQRVPDNPNYYFDRASAYQMTGKYNDAIIDYTKSKSLNGDIKLCDRKIKECRKAQQKTQGNTQREIL